MGQRQEEPPITVYVTLTSSAVQSRLAFLLEVDIVREKENNREKKQ
jgi:hypothetical protein